MVQSAAVAEFSSIDYIVFVLVLVASLAIGTYYGIRGKNTTDEFLLASRSMAAIPTGLSLAATLVSSISLLGMFFLVDLIQIIY